MACTHASGGRSGKGLPAARAGASGVERDPGDARDAGTFRLIDSLRFWFDSPDFRIAYLVVCRCDDYKILWPPGAVKKKRGVRRIFLQDAPLLGVARK
jgi:hypothetical protein